ncbi:MAG: HAMP domain-containing sensor histidine kinase [Patescibacteria group bacterium]
MPIKKQKNNTKSLKLEEEIEKLKKLSSVKTDLVSISAHQVRTSLSALKWIIKMFLDGDLGELTSEQENLMKKAFEGNQRAINVISELLLVNRTENIQEKKYKFSELNLEEMIESCIFDFSGEAHAQDIEIIFLKSQEREPAILADREKIRVVFQNLIENAIKYSKPHGKIFISLKEINGKIEISIKDAGIGISEEEKKKIFEKFYRTPSAQKKEVIGSGIGLFTSKQIIEKHNGKIWFESKENDGTTFFFTIPTFKNKEKLR